MFRKILLVVSAILAVMLSTSGLAEKAFWAGRDDYPEHLAFHIGDNAQATGNYIKVRTKPNGDKIAGHLEIADSFIIQNTSGKWVQIEVTKAASTSPDSWNGLTGWVDGNYVDCGCTASQYESYAGNTSSTAASDFYDGTLTESCTSYDELIALHRDAAKNIRTYSCDYLQSFFVEPYTSFSGYMIRDINNDGTDECLFMDKPGNPDSMIYSIYTIKNGKTHRIMDGWTRNRLQLLTDGRIYSEGSDGAAYSIMFVYEIKNGESVFSEGYASTDDGWYRILDGSYPELGITDQMIPVDESEVDTWNPGTLDTDATGWHSLL